MGRTKAASLAAACVVIAMLVLSAQASGEARVYEMVTPQDSLAYIPSGETASAVEADGSMVYYVSVGSPLGIRWDGWRGDYFMAGRGAQQWDGAWLTPFCPGYPFVEAPFGSECDHNEGLAPGGSAPFYETHKGNVVFGTSIGADPLDRNGRPDVYLGSNSGVTLLSGDESGKTDPGGVGVIDANGLAVSPDLNAVAWYTPDRLIPSLDTDDQHDIYANVAGKIQLVTSGPDGDAAPCPVATCAIYLNAINGGTAVNQNAINDDGSRIFFTTQKQLVADDLNTTLDLYTKDLDSGDVKRLSPDGTTEGCSGTLTPAQTNTLLSHQVDFDFASEDGSAVWFSTQRRFDEGVPCDAAATIPYRVYRADVDTGAIELVSEGADTAQSRFVSAPGSGGEVTLFWSTSVVAGSGVPGDVPANNRKLYLRDGTTTTYVGNIHVDGTGGTTHSLAGEWEWRRDIRWTSDGSAAVFATKAQLVPTDTNAATDIYKLTIADKSIQLLSPRGSAPGAADAVLADRGRTSIEFHIYRPHRGRALSEDGSRVFFSTTEALTEDAGDNGRNKIYEWRADRPAADPLVLVSPPGDDAPAVRYVDNSSDGSDVFFSTAASLWSGDRDGGAVDIYNAREGDAFSDPGVERQAPCVGDDCQSPVSGSPGPISNGSAALKGRGNVMNTPRSAGPLLRVGRRAVARGPVARLRVRVSGPGRVRVRGPRLRSSVRRVARDGVFAIRVRLSPRPSRLLNQGRRVRSRATVIYVDAKGRRTSKRVPITFKRKPSARSNARAGRK